MTTGAGAQAIGEWYGTGQEGGMALVFSVTGVLGVVFTLIAFNSRPNRLLSATYAGTLEEGALPSHPADSFSDRKAAAGTAPQQILFVNESYSADPEYPTGKQNSRNGMTNQ